MSLLTTELRLLDPRGTPVNTDILHLQDPITGKDYRVNLQDLITGGGYPVYSPDETYSTTEGQNQVTYGFRLWKWINVTPGNSIPSEGANWTEVSPNSNEIDGGTP